MCDQGDQHVPEGVRDERNISPASLELHSAPDPHQLPSFELCGRTQEAIRTFAHHVLGGSHGHVSSLDMEMEAVVTWIHILPSHFF